MLKEIDKIRIKKFMGESPELDELIHKILDDHQLEISQISHEIRNPVTLINSSLQLIEKQHPEVKDFNFWSQTMDDMKNLRELLDDLSHYNNGRRLNKARLDVNLFLHELADSAKAWGEEQNCQIFVTAEGLLPDICADPVKLRQGLTNLLKNAIESSHGKTEISITAKVIEKTEEKESQLLIEIRDNGDGIPPEYLPSLFEPFVTHKQNGTGLGLAVTKRIIETHGGCITVRSDEGKGTCFSILMPVYKGEDKNERTA